MKKYISGILSYFYILIFKRKIKSDYPCKASPFFLMRLDRKLKHIHLGSAFIGRDVKISTGCKFFENPLIYGKVNINKYTSINGPGTRIFAHLNHIKIGSFCSIASNVIIQEYNHDYKYISTYNFSNEIFGFKTENISSKGDIEIQDDVWIGSNSVILSGVTIGRGSIIGAGSIVTKDIPPYSIAAGNPAVVIKKRFSEATIDYIEKLEWWKWDENTIQKKKHLFTSILDINMTISGKGE